MDVVPGSWTSFMANLVSLVSQLNKQTLHPVGKGNWAYFDSVRPSADCTIYGTSDALCRAP